jgi:hypothetical protein
VTDELRRCRRFGWTLLAAWASFGLAIEAAHGFKLGAYLDDRLRHTILRLAHAHGAILVLAFPATLSPNDDERGARAARRTGLLLRAASLRIPTGFAAGAVAPHEGDPGWPGALVPIGGLCSSPASSVPPGGSVRCLNPRMAMSGPPYNLFGSLRA